MDGKICVILLTSLGFWNGLVLNSLKVFENFKTCGAVQQVSSLVFPTELTFSWIFNEYPSFVKQDTRRFVSQKTGSLYIAKVEPSDVGNYTCVVTNTVTQSRVQGPPTPLILRSDGDGLTICILLRKMTHLWVSNMF